MEIPLSIKKSIRNYQPIVTDGLTLYPIEVREYEEYLTALPAIEMMQQSMELRYISLPLLQAYYQMDFEAAENGSPVSGLLYRSILFLALALRSGEGKGEQEKVRAAQIITDANNPKRLKAVCLPLKNGEMAEITPVLFQRIRPILAEQNGIELIPDSANPELVQAERDIAEQSGVKLKADFSDMIATIAMMNGVNEETIDNWPILKMLKRKRAAERVLAYLVCGIGESSGGKFKNGNPFPSPFFDRDNDTSSALTAIEDFVGGEGLKAINRA